MLEFIPLSGRQGLATFRWILTNYEAACMRVHTRERTAEVSPLSLATALPSRDMQYTFMPRVREGVPQPPPIPIYSPRDSADLIRLNLRNRCFLLALPDFPSQKSLLARERKSPLPGARARRTGDFTGFGNLLRREYSPTILLLFRHFAFFSCVSFDFVPFASGSISSK